MGVYGGSTSEVGRKVRILLVGIEGNGKSSCVETIENSGPIFENTNASGCDITGTDTSRISIIAEECTGVGDTGTDLNENIENVINDVSNKITDPQINEPIAAIALVMKYGVRFTKQEKDSVEVVKLMFGNDVFKEYGIIIMTYGDLFRLEHVEEGLTFDKWRANQTGDIVRLFEEVGNRIVLFDNKTTDSSIKDTQYKQLYYFATGIGKKYGKEQFDKAESGREELIKREKPTGENCTSLKGKTATSCNYLEKLIHHKERLFILIYWLIFLAILILCVLYLVGKLGFYQGIMILVIFWAFWKAIKFTFKHFGHRSNSYNRF